MTSHLFSTLNMNSWFIIMSDIFYIGPTLEASTGSILTNHTGSFNWQECPRKKDGLSRHDCGRNILNRKIFSIRQVSVAVSAAQAPVPRHRALIVFFSVAIDWHSWNWGDARGIWQMVLTVRSKKKTWVKTLEKLSRSNGYHLAPSDFQMTTTCQ